MTRTSKRDHAVLTGGACAALFILIVAGLALSGSARRTVPVAARELPIANTVQEIERQNRTLEQQLQDKQAQVKSLQADLDLRDGQLIEMDARLSSLERELSEARVVRWAWPMLIGAILAIAVKTVGDAFGWWTWKVRVVEDRPVQY